MLTECAGTSERSRVGGRENKKQKLTHKKRHFYFRIVLTKVGSYTSNATSCLMPLPQDNDEIVNISQ